MIVRLLPNLVLFLVPFVVYGIYIFALRHLRPEEEVRSWATAPFHKLVLSGIALGILGLVASAIWSGDNPVEKYEPKKLEGAPHLWSAPQKTDKQ